MLRIRFCVGFFLVSIGIHLKIFRSMRRVLKQEEVTALTWDFMMRLVSRMRPRFLAWSVVVGPSLAGTRWSPRANFCFYRSALQFSLCCA